MSRYRSRRNYSGKGGTSVKNYSLINVNAKANLALAQIDSIKGSLNVEYKAHTATFNAAIGTAWQITHLHTIPQGDAENQRDGEQCKLKSVYMKGIIEPDTGAANTLTRVCIIKDTKSDGTAPTATEIFESNTLLTFINIDEKRRFITLYDKVYTHGSDQDIKWCEWYKTFNHVLEYTSTAGTGTRASHYYLCVISNSAANGPTLDFRIRSRYIDN